ncbi:MAG: HAD-IA family hydrolase [Desulfovibrio sp.]|jgi:phosphoglycolate phosphatase-like HAD superfamily hydrolase|nr:HAD-IA family hydrolase [Desulfovibrio sp.]
MPETKRNGAFASELNGLVFDIDGVMLDSRASNMEFYNLIREAVRLPPLSPEEEEYCHMASEAECLARIIPPKYREAAYEARMKISYTVQILPLLSLESGLPEALRWLDMWGVKLGIFTNRNKKVHELLHYFGLEDFFLPVMTASDCPPKPCPDGLVQIAAQWGETPANIAFLGDSRVDEQAARGAGAAFWSFRNAALDAGLHVDNFFDMITMITPLVENPGPARRPHKRRPAAEDAWDFS